MTVRSRRLNANVSWGDATDVVLYTVASDRTAIVRGMIITNNSSSNTGTFSLRLNGTSSGFNMLTAVPIAGSANYVVPFYFVLNPDDVLYGRGNLASKSLRTYLFGSLLEGVPA